MYSMQTLGLQVIKSMAQDFRPDETAVLDDEGNIFTVDLSGFEPSDQFKVIGEHRCQEWIEREDCTNHVWVPV